MDGFDSLDAGPGKLIVDLAQSPVSAEMSAIMVKNNNGEELEKETRMEGMDEKAFEDDDKPEIHRFMAARIAAECCGSFRTTSGCVTAAASDTPSARTA